MGIGKKKFEGMKQSLSVQIQGQVASGNTKCWIFSANHLTAKSDCKNADFKIPVAISHPYSSVCTL